METRENLLGVLKSLFKWKKQILYVCAAAALGSIIIVLLLPVYYQAHTVFLAASPDQAKPELLFSKGTLEGEYYGNENDIDRILTLAESTELVDFLIDSFNLYEHYKIDPEGPRSPYWVRKKFASLYEVKKTKRDAIQLSMEDRDPELAATIAKTARIKINQITQNLIKESQLRAMNTYDDNIKNKERLLNVLGDSLVILRGRYGIYNTESQTETLTAQYSQSEARLIRNRSRLEALRTAKGVKGLRDTIIMVEALIAGIQGEVDTLRSKIALFNEGMAKVDIFEKQYAEANLSLSQDQEKNKQLQATYKSDIPAILLVEEASVPIIKSRPQRKIIVLASVVIAFLFCIVAVLLIENYKDINWREIYHGK